MEKWKIIDRFSDYEISDIGRVRNTKTKYILSNKNIKNGYIQAGLCINGKASRQAVHRLVAVTFVPNPDNNLTVNHKDGNKLNNVATNLE